MRLVQLLSDPCKTFPTLWSNYFGWVNDPSHNVPSNLYIVYAVLNEGRYEYGNNEKFWFRLTLSLKLSSEIEYSIRKLHTVS